MLTFFSSLNPESRTLNPYLTPVDTANNSPDDPGRLTPRHHCRRGVPPVTQARTRTFSRPISPLALRHARVRGFTLLEILIAMSVILILAGALIFGFTSVGNSSRTRATKVTLENLRGMVTELDVTGGMGSLPIVSVIAPTDVSTDGK